MKTLIFVAGSAFSLLTVAARGESAIQPPAVADVVKLTQAAVKTEVVQKFVESSTAGYSLKAEDVLYLKEQGVADEVIVAMLKKSKGVKGFAPTASQAAQITAAETGRSNMAQGSAEQNSYARPYIVSAPPVNYVYVQAPAPVYIYETVPVRDYYYSSVVDPFYSNYGFGFSYSPAYRSHWGYGGFGGSHYHYAGSPYRASFSYNSFGHSSAGFGFSYASGGSAGFRGSAGHATGFGGRRH